MPPVPKPPVADANAMQKAWYERVLKPDGAPYSAFQQFAAWKRWVDQLRDYTEANRITSVDQKSDIDRNTASINSLDARVTALEEKPSVPFPASG